MASTLASLCLSQRRTFWTYVVTISLFSLYLMNFCVTPCLMQRILLRQHYKSMKRHVLFSQGSIRTLVRRGGHFFSYMSKKFLPLYISAKIIKIDQDFPKLWSQMYCHLFYGSQCIQSEKCSSVRWDITRRKGTKNANWQDARHDAALLSFCVKQLNCTTFRRKERDAQCNCQLQNYRKFHEICGKTSKPFSYITLRTCIICYKWTVIDLFIY